MNPVLEKIAGEPAQGPLVTVLVPAFNGEAYLRESLDSILAQHYKPVEIVLLDDASTDGTPDIAAGYGARIRYVRRPRNLGQFANVNAGIANATGEFIAVFHADDVYDPTILTQEVEFLRSHPEIAAVFCLDKFIDAQGHEYGRLILPPEVREREVITYNALLELLLVRKNTVLRTPGALVRRRIYGEVGLYDPSYGIGADLEMWLRIARLSAIGLLHKHLFSYRHFHGNLSHHYRHLRTTPDVFFQIIDEHLESGGRDLVPPAALAGFEAHRAEETLMNAVSFYISGDLAGVRRTIAPLRASVFLQGIGTQRVRMLALLCLLRVLPRLPRIAAVSDAFQRRWYARAPRTVRR